MGVTLSLSKGDTELIEPQVRETACGMRSNSANSLSRDVTTPSQAPIASVTLSLSKGEAVSEKV